jgi:hypothetical protein
MRFIEGYGLHSRSALCLSVVDFDLQHWVLSQQLCRCLFGGTLFRELSFEVPIDHHRVSVFGRDVCPLKISWLLFFYAKSWSLHFVSAPFIN